MKCSKCLEEKTASDYYLKSKGGTALSAYCKDCLYAFQKLRWKKRKTQMIELMGGQCQLCGYSKCQAALELHHIDSSSKTADWSRLRMMKWETVLKELENCILLCSNCHREKHWSQIESALPDPGVHRMNSSLKQTSLCPSCKEPCFGTKYCSKECCYTAKRKVQRPPVEELQKKIQSQSLVSVGEEYGVSDNAIRKWMKFYGIVKNHE